MTEKVKYKEGTVKPEHVRPDAKYVPKEQSLANLKPKWDKEHMRKMAYKSHESRKKNKEVREALKQTILMLDEVGGGLVDKVPDGLTMLKMAMMRAVQEDDLAEIVRIAAIIAEYERPKLQRTENINANMDFSDLSDDELQRQLDMLNGKQTEKVIEHEN